VGRLHPVVALAGLQRGGLAPLSRDQLRTRADAGLALKLSLFGWDLRLASLSLNHQSNGRALPLSRSWNRVIATLAAERGDWVAEFRPWVRITESHTDDDNPDIEDHIGRAELRLGRYTKRPCVDAAAAPFAARRQRSRGSAQLEWVVPLSERPARLPAGVQRPGREPGRLQRAARPSWGWASPSPAGSSRRALPGVSRQGWPLPIVM
jgi:hypothetical protein